MKTLLTAILLSASIFPAAWAQNDGASQDKNNGAISGTVIDSVSEQPVKGAEVRLRGTPGDGTPAAQAMSAVSDAAGRFAFEGLPTGRYFLNAGRDGYVGEGSRRGKMQLLSPGQRLTDVVLRLLPGGNISGHITDEAGKPLRGAAVQAMKSSYVHGHYALQDVAHATSDEAGEYRMTGLAPGKFYIYAKVPASLNAKLAAGKAYVPLYYSAATEQSRAVSLALRAGEELGGIDMNFAPAHTVHVRGRVIDARTSLPCKEAEVTLLSDQGETVFAPSQTFTVGGVAAFDFPGVPPGSYVLTAQPAATTQQTKVLWGRTLIEVGDANLEHADVLVSTGTDVSGHIRVEGKTPLDLTKMVAVLEPQEGSALAGQMPDIDNASLTPDGGFIFREVPEGTYHISFNPVPPGFYLKTAGGTDLLETGIAVGRGRAPAGLDLVLSPGVGRVDGTIMSDDKPFQGATVVLVPEGKRSLSPTDYRQGGSDQMGRFALRNVVPGDYTVFAWEHVERDAYMDPDFLGRYEDNGKAVHVDEDGHVSLQLEVIPDLDSSP